MKVCFAGPGAPFSHGQKCSFVEILTARDIDIRRDIDREVHESLRQQFKSMLMACTHMPCMHAHTHGHTHTQNSELSVSYFLADIGHLKRLDLPWILISVQAARKFFST